MTPAEITGLVMSVGIMLIPNVVYLADAYLWATGRPTISAGVWADLDRWREGQGPFPVRSVLLPVGIAAAGIVSGIGLAMHFFL